MKTEKRKYRRSFKGAVLFTILVVMVILVILMITTIGLASAASKRAYREYNDHQTNLTARSLVDAVIESMSTDPISGEKGPAAEMGGDIITRLKNDSTHPVVVTVNTNGQLDDGMGVVNSLEFSLVGTDGTGAGNYYINGTGDLIIKVTATVTQGGVTSTYSQYVVGDKGAGNNRSSGGGFVAFGRFESVNADGPSIYAPAYVAIEEATAYDKIFNFYNDTINRGILINSSAEINAMNPDLPWVLSKGEGTAIMGNFDTKTNEFVITTNYTPDSADSLTDTPYLYVGGTFRTDKAVIGEPTHPLNIYCGRLIFAGNGGSIYANVYCYNNNTSETLPDGGSAANGWQNEWANADANASTESTKSWSRIGNNGSNLVDWVSTLAAADQAQYQHLRSGSFYTMGNLELTSRTKIGGDIFVNGTLNLNNLGQNTGDVEIGGNIYVNGKVTSSGEVKGLVNALTASGKKIYCNDFNGSSAFDAVKENYPSTLPANIEEFRTGKFSRSNVENDIITKPSDALDGFTEEAKNSSTGAMEKHKKDAINVSQLNINEARIYYAGATADKKVRSRKVDGTDDREESASTVNFSVDYNYKSGTYTGSISCDAVITEGCTLAGGFYGKTILFQPSEDIWVNLYDVEMESCKIYVDDTSGRVNFYLIDDDNYFGIVNTPDNKYEIKEFYQNDDYEAQLFALTGHHVGEELDATDKYVNKFEMKAGHIDFMTLNYYKNFMAGNNIDLITNPTAANDYEPGTTTVNTKNDWMVPGILMAASETSKVYVAFDNTSTYTGDLYVPRGVFYKGSGASNTVHGGSNDGDAGSKVTWNGTEMPRKDLQWVGSLIVDGIKSVDNKFMLCYVDDPAGGAPVVVHDDLYKWEPIAGFADY